MKKLLLSMAVLLTLCSTVPLSAQRHRHTPRTTVVGKSSTGSNNQTSQASAPKNKDNVEDEGIEAYSDTSYVADDTTSNSGYDSTSDDNAIVKKSKDPVAWLINVFSSGAAGVTIAIVIIITLLLFLFAPLIVVLLIIRYIIRRHNDRVRLAEKAIEQGMPLTDEEMPLSRKSPDYMWRRGVRNVSIGLGLMILMGFLGTNELIGIGGLVACLGAGQMFMVRYNYNSQFGNRKKKGKDDGLGNFDNISSDITDSVFEEKSKEDDNKGK